jgi:hypothetical protein
LLPDGKGEEMNSFSISSIKSVKIPHLFSQFSRLYSEGLFLPLGKVRLIEGG